jgi:hypothetical protein
MANISGYFDDSGTHLQSETAVCAGYVATVEQWKELERNWREVDNTEHFGVFHTAAWLGGYKQFKGWEASRKERVFRRLIGIINARVRHGFISAVVKKDYDEIVPDWIKARSGKYHYTFCVWSCLAFISQWRQQRKMIEPFQYVFDRMGKGKGEIISVLDSFIKFRRAGDIGVFEGGYSFQGKEEFVQLQAADIIASAAGWHMNNRVIKGRSDQAESWFKDVMSLRPKPRNRYFDRENLTEWVAKMEKHKDDPNWGIQNV